ncbi:MAG: glutamine-hydrolyzing synthase, partial [Actinomycetota bacterium]
MADSNDISSKKVSINRPLVLVVDFGAQYAQLIARRVRQAGIFSEIVGFDHAMKVIDEKKPDALILSGGPSSVYETGAPNLNPDVLKGEIPVFGICYGFQVMAQLLGGEVGRTGLSEFGRTEFQASESKLFGELPKDFRVWMSHGDSVSKAPDGFKAIGAT